MSIQPLDHDQIIELLPDYAIGSLDHADLELIGQHLETCLSCRAELLRILELGALISDVTPPTPEVRQQLLNLAVQSEARLPAMAPVPSAAQPAPVPIWSRRQRAGAGGGLGRRAQAMLAAAAALLIIGLGVANIRLRGEDQRYADLAELVSTATVHPLTESQFTPRASGVLFAAADDTRALLIADDLPILGDDEEYQVWLFDEVGETFVAGLFSADEEEHAQIELSPPLPVSSYIAVAVSAEPAGGSEEPTGPLALGGWFDSP